MKDGQRSKNTPADHEDVKSSDIPNAHASGDGAMGRNDEKLEERPKDDKENNNSKDETSSY